jgi:hypothetical protein
MTQLWRIWQAVDCRILDWDEVHMNTPPGAPPTVANRACVGAVSLLTENKASSTLAYIQCIHNEGGANHVMD